MKRWKTAVLAIDIAAAALGVAGCGIAFAGSGFQSLIYYTQDSNIFGVIANAAHAIALIRELRGGKAVGEKLRRLKYFAACCLMITFTVVVTLLAPAGGPGGYKRAMIDGSGLYLHTLCPLLTFISVLLPDGGAKLPVSCALYALAPTLIYGVPAVIFNITGALKGPYFFLQVHVLGMPAALYWLAGVLAGAYVLGLLILILLNATKHKTLT